VAVPSLRKSAGGNKQREDLAAKAARKQARGLCPWDFLRAKLSRR